mmetsp:Transcript_92714/g.246315  ORF Transcript_92714/g.246315 Transcript_92714/m.246315 type:complete len:263 (-) Transcript_92714:94-882(-)
MAASWTSVQRGDCQQRSAAEARPLNIARGAATIPAHFVASSVSAGMLSKSNIEDFDAAASSADFRSRSASGSISNSLALLASDSLACFSRSCVYRFASADPPCEAASAAFMVASMRAFTSMGAFAFRGSSASAAACRDASARLSSGSASLPRADPRAALPPRSAASSAACCSSSRRFSASARGASLGGMYILQISSQLWLGSPTRVQTSSIDMALRPWYVGSSSSTLPFCIQGAIQFMAEPPLGASSPPVTAPAIVASRPVP